MSVCPKCGRKTAENADFCYYCGAKISEKSGYIPPIRGQWTAPGQAGYAAPVQEKRTVVRKTDPFVIVLSAIAFALIILIAVYMITSGSGGQQRLDHGTAAASSEFLAVDHGGVKIYFRRWILGNGTSSPGAELRVSNERENNIVIMAQDVSADGKPVNGSLYETIRSRSSKTVIVDFDKEELSAGGVSSPSEIQMRFILVDSFTGEKLYTSDLFAVKIKK